MNEQTICKEAAKIVDPARRAAFLDQACNGDADLRRCVEALLQEQATTAPLHEQPGAVIGRYKLLQRIGEGGMGVVFMAEQQEPVRRMVALKIIKPGMDSVQVVTRFEAERQALALMDHPNIAKVLDGGATESGRPYFVMELVKGVPITKYCDDNHLTPKERLELFVPVCQAIQHAHQKGIIHRDIKPTNVLVTSHDGKPVPKIIDFGVAKATSQRLTDKTMFTEFGAVIGTLEYMSPEQAEMSGLDIDTRSDIYSLGVLLYQLLTGSTPFERRRLRTAALGEMLRIIREEEPQKPSTRVSTAGESLPSLAAQRKMEPRKLSRLMRGELDWIVMKALEKDRTRRYETANGFAMDIQRYLADEPVLAGPPSARYRLRKFTQRNKAAVVAAVLLLGTLLAGIAGTTIGLVQARRDAERARTAEKKAADEAAGARAAETKAANEAASARAAEKKAADEAAIARAVSSFLNDDLLAQASPFEQAGPNRPPDLNVKLATVLDRAAEKIPKRFPNQPLVEAAVRATIGRTYLQLGSTKQANTHLSNALQLYQKELGDDHPDTLETTHQLGILRRWQGKYLEAERLQLHVLEARRAHPGRERREETLAAMNELAMVYMARNNPDAAEKLLDQAVLLGREQLGTENLETLGALHHLGQVYLLQGKYEKAEQLFHDLEEVCRRKFGKGDPNTLYVASSQVIAYAHEGQWTKAEELGKEVLELRSKYLGPEHPDTLVSMNTLAELHRRQGKYAEALAEFKEILERMYRVLGKEHRETLRTENSMGLTYLALEKNADAERLFQEALDKARRTLGKEDWMTLVSMNNLGQAYQVQGQFARAEVLLVDSLRMIEELLGKDHPDTLWAVKNLGRNYLLQNRLAETEPYYERVLEGSRSRLGEKHRYTVEIMHDLASVYVFQGKHDKAAPLLAELRKTVPALYGDLSRQMAALLAIEGLDSLNQKQFAESEISVRDCLQIREKLMPNSWQTSYARSMLGEALAGQKKYTEAETLLLESYETLKRQETQLPSIAKPRIKEAGERIVQLYGAWGKPDKVKEWREKLKD